MFELQKYRELKQSLSFYSDVYNFYIKGGYRCLVSHYLFQTIATFFMHAFITFITFVIDWRNIFKCKETICNSISIIGNISGIRLIILTIFSVISFLYCIWLLLSSVSYIRNSRKYINYYKYALKLDPNNLKVVTWSNVMQKMIEYDNDLNKDIIIGSIMRKQNYWIALVSNNIFTMRKTYYSAYFEWMINWCILRFIFKGKKLDRSFLSDNKGIKHSMIAMGIIGLILSPFIFFISLANVIINCITDFYTNKTYFGPKDWSKYAKVIFRDYNELDHIFERRIELSHKYTTRYENRFSSNFIQYLTNFGVKIIGTLLSVLVFIAFYDEILLLNINLFGRNLLWYVTIFTTLIAFGRSILRNTDYIEKTHDQLLNDIATYTHYYPERWRKDPQFALKSFYDLYNYKFVTLLRDLSGIFIVPFLMIFSFPKKVNRITTYIKNITIEDTKLGSVCKFTGVEPDVDLTLSHIVDIATTPLLEN